MSDFTPSQIQFKVRGLARGLMDGGIWRVSDWIRAIDELDRKTWRSWKAQPGFLEWWREDLSEQAPLDELDLLVLDNYGAQALIEGLEAGSPQALATWAKLKIARDRAQQVNEQNAPAAGAEELQKWLEDAEAGETAWTPVEADPT